MMAFLRRFLRAEPQPITYLNTAPADRDEQRENEIRAIHQQMAHARVNIGRTSAEIRRELAGNALRIVSGE